MMSRLADIKTLETPADAANLLAQVIDGFAGGKYDLDAVRTITELVKVWLACHQAAAAK